LLNDTATRAWCVDSINCTDRVDWRIHGTDNLWRRPLNIWSVASNVFRLVTNPTDVSRSRVPFFLCYAHTDHSFAVQMPVSFTNWSMLQNVGQKVQSNTTQGCRVYVLSNKQSRHIRNTRNTTCFDPFRESSSGAYTEIKTIHTRWNTSRHVRTNPSSRQNADHPTRAVYSPSLVYYDNRSCNITTTEDSPNPPRTDAQRNNLGGHVVHPLPPPPLLHTAHWRPTALLKLGSSLRTTTTRLLALLLQQN
jgi:hypothetical protein